MPKPDGTLYWYEKERLSEKAEPKAKKKKAVSLRKPVSLSTETAATGKPVGVAKAQSVDSAEASDANRAIGSNVVSIDSGEPVRKRMGPKPGHSNHPLQPNKGGRPIVRVKATPELVAAICAKIKGGLSIESSCILHGISRAGIDRWRKINPSVNAQFEKAETEFEDDILSHIRTKAPDDIKAATWLLERGRPQRWAQVSKNELTGKDGKPMPSLSIAKSLVGSMSVKGDPATKIKVAV